MCFLYRQSISIVYESKFKYIYRYFIKIDRCFCEILQSLPLRKCGLKLIPSRHLQGSKLSLPLRKCGLKYAIYISTIQVCSVTSLAEVWIEMLKIFLAAFESLSLPLRKCGLKYLFSTT